MKLFNRDFSFALILIFCLEALSLVGYFQPNLNGFIFGVLAAGLFYLAYRTLYWGVLCALTELFIGGKGQLLSVSILNFNLSLREAIFGVLMLIFLIHLIQRKIIWPKFIFKKYLLILAGFIALGVVVALIRGTNFSNLFFDVNGWCYFAYIFIFLPVFNTRETFNRLWNLLAAGLLAISLKTLTLLYLFSHNLAPRALYTWIRDTGVGEITLLGGNVYRIFFQSHIYILIGFFVFLALYLFERKKQTRETNRGLFALLSLSFAVNLISLSRSNWLGFIGAALILSLIILFHDFKTPKELLKKIGLGFLLGTTGFSLILLVVYFPLPAFWRIDPAAMFRERLFGGAAVSSRWQSLPVLGTAILTHPFVGSGWGKELTYKSADPRIVADTGTGVYTTTAFEWGYLDIAVKIGLLGLAAYLYLIYRALKVAWRQIKGGLPNKSLLIGLTLGFCSLIITHAASPYLNHPLGIGFVLLFLIYLNFNQSPLPLEQSAN
jgi:O-antigen ligase